MVIILIELDDCVWNLMGLNCLVVMFIFLSLWDIGNVCFVFIFIKDGVYEVDDEILYLYLYMMVVVVVVVSVFMFIIIVIFYFLFFMKIV